MTDDKNINIFEELDIEQDSIGPRDIHDYRVIMYNKLDVEYLEKRTIAKMLETNPKGPYSDTFWMKSFFFFPEKFPELVNKKKRGKKSNNYFIEDVGKWLWLQWKATGSADAQNDFLTYCYPLIDGVIFKYQRHKHGLPYEEIFQSAILKIIHAMNKFDPSRVVGHDDTGHPIYARVYTYFTMVLNYGITTITMAHGAEKITNVSLEKFSRLFSNEAYAVTDASIIFQEFLLLLDTLSETNDELITETNKKVILGLRRMLDTPENLSKLANNLVFSLKNECGVKVKDVTDTLELIKSIFGPLVIFSSVAELSEKDSEAW
jgi:hypothetical protein